MRRFCCFLMIFLFSLSLILTAQASRLEEAEKPVQQENRHGDFFFSRLRCHVLDSLVQILCFHFPDGVLVPPFQHRLQFIHVQPGSQRHVLPFVPRSDPFQSFFPACLDAVAERIAEREHVRRVFMSLVGGYAEPFQGFLIVFPDAVVLPKADAEVSPLILKRAIAERSLTVL